jgi:hypothetical protein
MTELQDECSESYWLKGYDPVEIVNKNDLPKDIIDKIELIIKKKMGENLMKKVVFTVGYEYDIEELTKKGITKDLQWEVPKYIINYAFYDKHSGIVYCMSFNVSKKGVVTRETVPAIDKKYFFTDFITQDEAIRLIKDKVKKRKLKKIDFENSSIDYNPDKKIFEWTFGSIIYKASIEAIPNGEIRFWKYKGTIFF